MTRNDLKLVLQFLFTFAFVAGSIITGAMLETGTAQMPRQAVVLLALITGFGVAAQRAQALMDGTPQQDLEQTVKQLVAQMRTVQVVAAQGLPTPPAPPARRLEDVIAKAAAQARIDAAAAAVPVTPQRVEDSAPETGTPKEG